MQAYQTGKMLLVATKIFNSLERLLKHAYNVDLLEISLNKNVPWLPVVTKMAKTASQCLGLLRRALPLPRFKSESWDIQINGLVLPNMKYACYAWIGDIPTSLSQISTENSISVFQYSTGSGINAKRFGTL
jgi:hypothetical protein